MGQRPVAYTLDRVVGTVLDPEVRRAATLRIKEMIDLIARQFPDWGQPCAHERALVTAATIEQRMSA